MRIKQTMRTSLILFIAILSFTSEVHAQRNTERASLELTFAGGASQLREPQETSIWSGATTAVDARIHGSRGFGGMFRFGTTFGRILGLEFDLGATYRGWIFHEGPRGVELGGGLGLSLFWNVFAPNLGVQTSLAGGPVGTFQIDYRDHDFVIGLSYVARWLPVGETSGIDTFTSSLLLRVGGEISL